jgi:hypothetical protein
VAERVVIRTVELTGSITLYDLRWAVSVLQDADPESPVEIREHRDHGPVDHDPAKITIHGRKTSGGDSDDRTRAHIPARDRA